MRWVKNYFLLPVFIPIHHFLGHLTLLVLQEMLNDCSIFTFLLTALIISLCSPTLITHTAAWSLHLHDPRAFKGILITCYFAVSTQPLPRLESSGIWSGQIHRNSHFLWLLERPQAPSSVSQKETRKTSTRCYWSKEEETPLSKTKAPENSFNRLWSHCLSIRCSKQRHRSYQEWDSKQFSRP